MEVLEFIFGQYREYSNLHIFLEICALVFSLASVYFSFKNSILVFPFGIISTLIFVYLLYQWNLLGDMVINGYYFVMSVYGWYHWLKGGNNQDSVPISKMIYKEWITAAIIGIITAIAIYVLYDTTQRLENWVSYIDMLTTGIFFAGMWLMARRKLEHWMVLALGNLISVPLYFYKGYSFSAFLYVFLFIIAIFGYQEWKKYLNNENLKV